MSWFTGRTPPLAIPVSTENPMNPPSPNSTAGMLEVADREGERRASPPLPGDQAWKVSPNP